MKTLNEVIKANECCDHGEPDSRCEDCPYNGIGACCSERETDAFHYLKELRDITDISMEYFKSGGTLQKLYNTSQISCPKCHSEFVILSDANNPLTWDELKQMEGKPVWVEVLSDEIDLSSRWMLIARETKAHSLPLAYTDDIGHWIFGHEDKLGKTWQAYRKERFNTECEDIPMKYFENDRK